MSKQAVKTGTTYVVLRDDRTPGEYAIWSEHKSEAAALKTCAAIGKNGSQGHTVVVPVAELDKWSK
jgi:hypothetical protein